MRTRQSFLPLSLETVPEDFAKVNLTQYCSRDEWINKGGLVYFLFDYSVCLTFCIYPVLDLNVPVRKRDLFAGV